MPQRRPWRLRSALLALLGTAALAVCPPAWMAALAAPARATCPLAAASSAGCGGCPERPQQQSCPSSCRRCDPIVTAQGARAASARVAPEKLPAPTPLRAPALVLASAARRLVVQGTSPPLHLLVVTLRN